MTPEERFERIESQLELFANFLSESAHRAEQRADQDRKLIEAQQKAIEEHEARMAQFDDALNTLATVALQHQQSFGQVAEQLQGVTEQLQVLTQAQKHTDERLNALIVIVERYFSNGQK
jgi:DNA repair ATPase RecN